ncbi:DUF4738 domain-containing protein [Marivirga tractuosa]|uniref:DUF4738 domain-containing protein n=1 Tax=Marivirga tractuosa TaxID=1006 RepID=UPI0035CFD490
MIKHYLFVSIALIAFVSCQSRQGHENGQTSKTESSKVVTSETKNSEIDSAFKKHSHVLQRLIPEYISTAKFDTLINEQNIQIRITKTYLDSYVLDEYEINDTIYQDKYRDSKIQLDIREGESILIDSTFTKTAFSKFADKEFLDIARFHRYWFKNLKDGRLEFFGVISKPETDWSFAFSQYFDLASKELTVEPYEDEEI